MTGKQADQILVDIINDKGACSGAVPMAMRARKEFSKTWREPETRYVNLKRILSKNLTVSEPE